MNEVNEIFNAMNAWMENNKWLPLIMFGMTFIVFWIYFTLKKTPITAPCDLCEASCPNKNLEMYEKEMMTPIWICAPCRPRAKEIGYRPSKNPAS